MSKLNGNDTIPYGVYSGLKLGNVVKMYGRKVLLEILKCNDVDDVYLKKYHYHHPATEEEKKNWELKKRQLEMLQEENSVSASMGEEFVTTATEVMEEEDFDQVESMGNTYWEESVLYDPEDDLGDDSSPSPEVWIQPCYEEMPEYNHVSLII